MSRVPGTFKRDPGSLVRTTGPVAQRLEAQLVQAGAIYARVYAIGDGCTVFVCREPMRDGYSWHLSISHPSRYPSYDELKAARYLAPELSEVPMMAQLFPKVGSEDEWVNVHEHVFHLHEVREEQ